MQEQKLASFKQKLEANLMRAQSASTRDELRLHERTRQMNAEIVQQAEANQSSDYNTKAIATRLRSIAKKRI